MVAKSVGRSQPSDNLCCVSHISGKDEIISQEEFISGCGKSGRRSRQVVRPNPRVLQARRGGGLGASGLAQEASAFAFTGLQRGDLFLWFILFCRFVEKSQVNVPCYAILCWWKESAHDVIWNGKAITRQWQKMPVIFSWSYFRIIYCQLQYFARSKYFCGIHLMKRGSESWPGLGSSCRQLNPSTGLSERWVAVQGLEKQQSRRGGAGIVCQELELNGEDEWVFSTVSWGRWGIWSLILNAGGSGWCVRFGFCEMR